MTYQLRKNNKYQLQTLLISYMAGQVYQTAGSDWAQPNPYLQS